MRIRNICRELKNKMGQTGPDRLITGNTGFPLFPPAQATDHQAGKPHVVFSKVDGNSGFAENHPM